MDSPPLGIMSVAGHVRSRLDLDIVLFNQREDNCTTEQITQRILERRPDIVGLGATTHAALTMTRVAEAVRTAAPKTLILLGGPHVSAVGAEKVLRKTSADVAVPGEGEVTTERVIEAWWSGDDFSGIPGIAWRNGHGEVVMNEGETLVIENLDELPFLPYDLIAPQKYQHVRSMGHSFPRRYAALFTSRGCPFRCNWCHRVHGKRFRAQSAERIVAELEHLIKHHGIHDFEFVDDVFNLDARRVIAFSELVLEHGLKIHYGFPNALRADLLTKEVIDALADSGLNLCSFALESGSPRIQALCGKNLDIERFVQAVEMAARRHVFCNGYSILGHPTETLEEMQATLRTARASMLHTCQFFTLTPYPGSEVYRLAHEQYPERVAHLDYESSNYYLMRANLSAVSDDVLFRFQSHAYRAFYAVPSRIPRILRDLPHRSGLFIYVPSLAGRMLKDLVTRA
ncbi:MAG TPA: radical SAM protein [Candidatus Hydrogenedentes bacterium]|nr:radical SAM protein [Candidatus Hydrogenedentota bacterium]HPG68193.1 radical SAM protein [Candidatus Hydrogenedentota bacterium]